MRNATNGNGIWGILDLPFHVYRLTAGLFELRSRADTAFETVASADTFDSDGDGAHDGTAILGDGLRGAARFPSRGA